MHSPVIELAGKLNPNDILAFHTRIDKDASDKAMKPYVGDKDYATIHYEDKFRHDVLVYRRQTAMRTINPRID